MNAFIVCFVELLANIDHQQTGLDKAMVGMFVRSLLLVPLVLVFSTMPLTTCKDKMVSKKSDLKNTNDAKQG